MHNHRRHLAGGFRRAHQIATDLPVALGGWIGDVFGNDVRVSKFNLLGERIIRAQGGEERAGGQTAQSEQRRPIQKLSPVDLAVGVVVVQFE
jgi:hypothetical protein